MQGHTQSSESIWTVFNNYTTAHVRQLKWQLKISWKRALGSGGFATVGSSLVGSTDIVSGLEGVITETDKFIYFDETDNLIRFEYDRSLQEPLGGIATSIGNLVLQNIDGRFTPNNNATIGTAILPNRPLQMFFGYLMGTVQKVVPIFKGLTRQPKESKPESTVAIECYDYIKFLNEFDLETEMYIDQTADEIIADILSQAGFGTSQYNLEVGLNTIGFAWFEKGQTAGERIKRIAEAEGGMFLQDEAGILRFYNRRHFNIAPFNAPVWDIDPDDCIRWEDDESTSIINRAIVKANPREVQSTTEVWRNGIEEVLENGDSLEVWATFEDPVTAITTPVAITDYIATTESGGTGIDKTSSVSVSVDLFTTAAKLTITNSSGTKVYMNLLRLRGTPAIVTSQIEEIFEDTVSVDKYTAKQVVIENDFIDDESFAAYLAAALVRKYKAPRRRMRVTIQGVPQLQIGDWVRLKDPKIDEYINCRVMRIQGLLDGGLFTQVLTLREIDSTETDAWAIVGVTQVGSTTEFVSI